MMHMQNYLCYNKIPNESKEQPSAKIMSTYQVSYNYERYSWLKINQVCYFDEKIDVILIYIHINTHIDLSCYCRNVSCSNIN